MKTIYLLVIPATLWANCAHGQVVNLEPSKESQAYHDYRMETTDPPFGLEKIRDLEKTIKDVEDKDGYDAGTRALSLKTYLTLSLREKFTYHMVHPESYSQNCDLMPLEQDEQKKIFGRLPDVFGEESWSDRQLQFFLVNRDSVITWMKYCIAKNNRVGLNFKHVIVQVNAKEMIPFLINTYNVEKKDHDILTVLLLLMKNSEYPELLTSLTYKKLYSDNESSYRAYLNFNSENEQLLIKRATNFYNSVAK